MAKKKYGMEGIGAWSEIKLNCIKQYLGAYTNILHLGKFKEFYFLDLFASAGSCESRKTKQKVQGSPLIALNIKPPFSKYYFFELDINKINELNKIKEASDLKDKIEIIKGDCNTTIDEVLGKIDNRVPFMALLDPQAGDLYWDTIDKIGQKNKAELFINFPFGMAINRYTPFLKGEKITPAMKEKLNKIFGNDNWYPIYEERRKKNLKYFNAREKYLDLYLSGLVCLGYKYYAVKNLKNSRNTHLYYLIFASKNRIGLEKMKDLLVKGELERNSLFFKQELVQKIYESFKGEKSLSLNVILEKLLSGKHCYRVQDFKDGLKILEKNNRLRRINQRKRATSFNGSDLFDII